MITSVDSNIFVALWDTENAFNLTAKSALASAHEAGNLVVAAPVYAELLAYPSRTEQFLDTFFTDTRIAIDWDLNESVWRLAGLAFQSYAARRRKQRGSEPRRIQADFLIGAHALENGYRLLTFDDRLYRAAFPHLTITAI